MVCGPQAEGGEGQVGLRPVLMDFGLARDSLGPQRLTQTGVIMGTPHYMAPEQARGQARHLDRRADVYSLGAILYEMLTGRPPFDAEHEVDLLLAVLNQDPLPPRQLEPSVPVDLDVIALKCLLKEPEHRYESALALAEDLQRYLHSEPILARPASTLYRIRRLAMRHRALVAVAGVLMLALCGVAGVTWRAKQKERVAAERAHERQRLAAELGQTLTKMNLFLRVAYSLPPHSLSREQALVREHLIRLQQQLASADESLHPTLENGIGRGHLALGEYQQAVEHLTRAVDLGDSTAGVHLVLGQSLGRLYEQQAHEIELSTSPEQAKSETARLRKELLVRARKELSLEQSTEFMSPAYVRAMLHFYSDDPGATYDAALSDARQAQVEAPWLLEPIDLEIKIIKQRYMDNIGKGKSPPAAESQALHDAIEHAIGVARSYPEFYASFNDYSLFHAKEMLLSSGNLKDADRVYSEGVAHAQVAIQLQPDSNAERDQLADLYSSWAYSRGWQKRDPSEPLAAGLVASQEALSRPPRRSRPYMARSKLHIAEMMYLDSQGADSQAATEQALADAREAELINPKNSDIVNLVVVSLSALTKLKHIKGLPTDREEEEILAAGQRAIDLRPDVPLPINNLATMYIEIAEDRIGRGLDATEQLGHAHRLVKVLKTRHPSYLLGRLCALYLETVELTALENSGQDTSEQAQQHLRNAEAALKESPTYSYLQEQVLEARISVLDAQLRHPGAASPAPLFDEALALVTAFSQNGLGEVRALQLRQELLLRKATWLKDAQKSPEPALAELFRAIAEQPRAQGGRRSELMVWQLRGLRIRAEWLHGQGRQAAALVAIEAGLEAARQAELFPTGLRHQVPLENGALLTLKAQLARTPGERMQLAGQAVSVLSEALKKRPPFKRDYGRFLKTAQTLSAA